MRIAPAGALLALTFALTGAVTPAGAAFASDGSVPGEVRAYVTGGGLVDRLDDIYGENADGEGIAFDETTEPGPISRVFLFTDERLAGDAAGKPVRMVNEWAVPVSLAGEPVGVATVWINPDIELPELAQFTPNVDAAVALAEVPDAARLVRLEEAAAWFALEDELLTPLVAGESGIAEAVPVDKAALVVPDAAPVADADPSAGAALAITVAIALFAVVVFVVWLSRRGPRARSPFAE